MGETERRLPRRRRRSTREDREFEWLVIEAIDSLPERFRRRLANVDVVVEEEPTAEDLADAGLSPEQPLFGLYQGTPLTQRTSVYGMVLPDKITIYRGPTLRACRTRRDVRWEVRQTIVHEFAHHFGISDEELDDLGL
ncbi:MAG: metallopeptidase family protein [Chloroflexota bacterium]